MKNLIISIIFIVLGLTQVQPAQGQNSLLYYVNQQRKLAHVALLKENASLNRSAYIKACDMGKRKYWSHVDPDGRHAWYLLLEQGYRYVWAGENLAKGFDNNAELVNAWYNSKTHKDIMLSPKYKDIGIARCGNFVVAHFGSKIK